MEYLYISKNKNKHFKMELNIKAIILNYNILKIN